MDELVRHTLGLNELWKNNLFSQDFLIKLNGLNSFAIVAPHLLNSATEFLSKFQYLDTKLYLPDNVLVKVDRMSMASSLEVRTLFLDHRIVELAAQIPASLKIKNNQAKYILRKALSDLIPTEISERGKQGFALPVDIWFRGELKDKIAASVEKARTGGIFNYRFLKSILDEHLIGRRNHQYILWPYMMYQTWHQKYMSN